MFQNGVIKLERTIDDNHKKTTEKKEARKEQVENVTSPEQAIEYVFNTWGIVVKNSNQAVKIASQKGVEFPFLKEKE
jgi:hypothetical protein